MYNAVCLYFNRLVNCIAEFVEVKLAHMMYMTYIECAA